MKFIQFFRNVGQMESVFVNRDMIVLVEEKSEQSTLLHLTNGQIVEVYESRKSVINKLEY